MGVTSSHVQAKLEAHERECVVRTEATQRQIESLAGRIRRLEALIMGSTVTLITGFITLFLKV